MSNTNYDVSKIDHFLETLKQINPVYSKQIRRTAQSNLSSFEQLANPMLAWAESVLGSSWASTLSHGYIAFVSEVNKSQLDYEESGHYKYSSFAEVEKITYGSADFMKLYHWGVYVTTFAWNHHLHLNDFFFNQFLPLLQRSRTGSIVDFGAGSGIWTALALSNLSGWEAKAVDISPTSVEWAKSLMKAARLNHRVDVQQGNALVFQPPEPVQAGISCFVLEHLEHPDILLSNICQSISPGSPAFVCSALTAAEVDHIYEFRRESELIQMAEDCGFRIRATLSVAPDSIPLNRRFIPRSMAMVLERRHGEWW